MPLQIAPPYAAAPGDASLHHRIPVHANFAEYAPIALLLLTMAELHGAWPPLLHLLCAAPVLGRLAYAWGVSHAPEDFRFRVGGMVTTLTVTLLAAVLLLVP